MSLLHPTFESHETEGSGGSSRHGGIGEITEIHDNRAIIIHPITLDIGINASRVAARCEIMSGIAIGNIGKCGGCAIDEGENGSIASQSTRCLGHHTVESGGYEANIGGYPIAEQHMIGGGIASREEIDRVFHFVLIAVMRLTRRTLGFVAVRPTVVVTVLEVRLVNV